AHRPPERVSPRPAADRARRGLMFESVRRRSSSSPTLLDIIGQVRRRWRSKLLLRGVLWVLGITLLLLLVAAYGLEWARYSPLSLAISRVGLLVVFLAAAAWFIVRPLRRRVTDEQVALYLEEHEPSLQSSLVSAV